MLAAVLAPIALNISIIILLAAFFRRSRIVGRTLFANFQELGWVIISGLIVVPFLIGLLIGTSRFATFLGHLFYTNMLHERDIRMTLTAWGLLLMLTFLVSIAL